MRTCICEFGDLIKRSHVVNELASLVLLCAIYVRRHSYDINAHQLANSFAFECGIYKCIAGI